VNDHLPMKLPALDHMHPQRDLWTDAIARASRPRSQIRRSRLRMLFLAVAVVAAIGAAAFGVIKVTEGSKPPQTSSGPNNTGGQLSAGPDWAPSADNPFPGEASAATLNQLAAMDPTLPLPNSSLANAHNVGAVWAGVNPKTNEVVAAIYYPASGIELMVAQGTIPAGQAQLSTIAGYPAVVGQSAPNGSPESSVPSPVQLGLALPDGRVLTLTGFRSANDLIEVAKTLGPASATAG
jgi:hypothetical protein